MFYEARCFNFPDYDKFYGAANEKDPHFKRSKRGHAKDRRFIVFVPRRQRPGESTIGCARQDSHKLVYGYPLHAEGTGEQASNRVGMNSQVNVLQNISA